MSKRYTYADVYIRIGEIGHTLLSDEFKTTKLPLTIKCKCGVIYEKRFDSFINGSYHCNGKIQRSKKEPVTEKNCLQCGIIFQPRINRTKYCSMNCSSNANVEKVKETKKKRNPSKYEKIYKECVICKKEFISKQGTILCSLECSIALQRTDEYRERAKTNGSNGGKMSVTSQQRRSKNEEYFAELCKIHFGKENVLTNEPMFEGWDADVILPTLKKAVMWNGVWHYKQVSKTQSLAQVQTRDRIKMDVIQKHGYTPYVIVDMGKYNRSFVEMEFECFLHSLIDI